jgi:hypothetical protein
MAAGGNDGPTVRVSSLKVGDWFAKYGSEWQVSEASLFEVTALKDGTGDSEFFDVSIEVLPIPDQTKRVRVDSLKPGDWFRRANGLELPLHKDADLTGWIKADELVTPIQAPPCPRTAPTPPIGTPEATGAQNGQEGGTGAEQSVSNNRPPGQGERWKGVSAADIPRLERLLAEQVAHGGQDGGAARRMLVMRERLRAEEHARSAAQWKRHEAYEHHQVRVGQLVDNGPGITSLKLDRPLIAYKRSGR